MGRARLAVSLGFRLWGFACRTVVEGFLSLFSSGCRRGVVWSRAGWGSGFRVSCALFECCVSREVVVSLLDCIGQRRETANGVGLVSQTRLPFASNAVVGPVGRELRDGADLAGRVERKALRSRRSTVGREAVGTGAIFLRAGMHDLGRSTQVARPGRLVRVAASRCEAPADGGGLAIQTPRASWSLVSLAKVGRDTSGLKILGKTGSDQRELQAVCAGAGAGATARVSG